MAWLRKLRAWGKGEDKCEENERTRHEMAEDRSYRIGVLVFWRHSELGDRQLCTGVRQLRRYAEIL